MNFKTLLTTAALTTWALSVKAQTPKTKAVTNNCWYEITYTMSDSSVAALRKMMVPNLMETRLKLLADGDKFVNSLITKYPDWLEFQKLMQELGSGWYYDKTDRKSVV